MLIATRSQPLSTFREVDSYSFVLNIFVPEVKNINRRQTSGGGFINGQGTSTDSCANAVVYTLVNGQLFANASSGTTQFGTDANTNYTAFTPQTNPGPITTTFAVDSSNNLIWNNVAFYNNFAQWCVRSDNSIIAVFVAPSLAPSDCIFVQLNLIRCKLWISSRFDHADQKVSNCVANIVGPQVCVFHVKVCFTSLTG